jgi:hypothetical protein
MGDALVELAARSLRVGDLPEQGGERPTVVVTMAYDKLAEQVGTGAFDTGEPLPAEAVRRYACDAKIIPAVLGGPGRPVDLGRSTRIISAALRRALTLRDGGCTFPLCEIPGKWCDVHHVDHWADGGRTDLNNTALVCGAHHTTTHHHGWIIRMAGDGLPEWIPPAWIDPHRRPRRHHRHKPPPPHTPTYPIPQRGTRRHHRRAPRHTHITNRRRPLRAHSHRNRREPRQRPPHRRAQCHRQRPTAPQPRERSRGNHRQPPRTTTTTNTTLGGGTATGNATDPEPVRHHPRRCRHHQRTEPPAEPLYR